MRIDDYIAWRKANGEVDLDGAYGNQCMDLWNDYCQKVLELTGNTGADCAKNILNNKYVMENFERIDNYPEFVPKKGDVAVWQGGPFGHVGICLGIGDIKSFRTLDQNWKTQKLTEEWHDYNYMAPLVFLRPKNQANIVDEQPKQPEFVHKVGELVVYSSCYRGNNDPIEQHIDCKSSFGSWMQDYIVEVVGGANPYRLNNGMFVNDGDIREIK